MKCGPLVRGDFLHQPHHSWAAIFAGDLEQGSDGSRNDTQRQGETLSDAGFTTDACIFD
jgi:hypothetical protein